MVEQPIAHFRKTQLKSQPLHGTDYIIIQITQNNGNGGWDYVPPYTSLVAAYERRQNGPGELIDDGDVAIASVPAFVIPEGAEIIE